MFSLKIKTDGYAFRDPFSGEADRNACQMEVSRILRELAEMLEQDAVFGKSVSYSALMDINGNRVGEMKCTF